MFIEEILVIFACINSTGCTQTSTEYFRRYPEVKVMVDRKTKKIRHDIGPALVDTVGPALFAISGGTGTIYLFKNTSLQFKKDSGILVWNWSY